MVKLRLTRMGATKAPFYRIVAMDSRKARDGKYIDQIGFYNPVSEPKQIVIDADKAKDSERGLMKHLRTSFNIQKQL